MVRLFVGGTVEIDVVRGSSYRAVKHDRNYLRTEVERLERALIFATSAPPPRASAYRNMRLRMSFAELDALSVSA